MIGAWLTAIVVIVIVIGTTKSIKVVIKSKPTSIELCNVLNKIAQDCGSIVASTYGINKSLTGLRYV